METILMNDNLNQLIIDKLRKLIISNKKKKFLRCTDRKAK